MPVIKRKNFKQNREIKLKVGDEAEKRDTNPILKAMDHEELEELADSDNDAYPYEPQASMPEQEKLKEEAYNQYITMQVIMLMDGVYVK